jgi:SAM-dependent methyltransferase
MSTRGPAFYDDDTIFATYMAHRQEPDNPPDTLEKPVLLDLVGEVAGLHILDLGCGAAVFGRTALEQGCRTYVGVEGSRNMVAMAKKTLADSVGEVIHATLEAWDYPTAAFDLVVSRLALHYIEDFAAVCTHVYQTLAPSGRFIFSVEHPVITSCAQSWQSVGSRQDWIVDTYFVGGPRSTTWLGGEVVRYHRTVEEYFGSLQRAGFVVEQLRESCPRPELFADEAAYEQHKRVPLFLFLAARKQ